MAWPEPTSQTEGTIPTGVTTGVPSIAISAHQPDDILVASVMAWVPNTTTPDAAQIPTPSGWNALGSQIGQPVASPRDGWMACFWKRATSSSETITLTRGSGWDTGSDTCYNGMVFSFRNCRTTGDPFENVTTAGPYTTANQNTAAVTVGAGPRRLVTQFALMQDNLTLCSAASGYIIGAAKADAGGTDSAFRIAYRYASSDVAATASTTSVTGLNAGAAYGFIACAFVPEYGDPSTIDVNMPPQQPARGGDRG